MQSSSMSTILQLHISFSLLALPKVQSAPYAAARWDQTLKQHTYHLRWNVDDVNLQLELEAFDLYLALNLSSTRLGVRANEHVLHLMESVLSSRRSQRHLIAPRFPNSWEETMPSRTSTNSPR
jgi:hypothetical protein